MDPTPYAHAAVTAFLVPGGWGPLLVWRACPRELLRVCRSDPRFDPQGHIEALLMGGCEEGTHPGREALEDRFRRALAWPGEPGGLESGSAAGRRAMALTGAGALALDREMGFLDLLIHVPDRDAPVPRPALRRPREALPEGAMRAWGVRVEFCGVVDEGQWDSYAERAAAVAALLERGALDGCVPGQDQGRDDPRGRGRL